MQAACKFLKSVIQTHLWPSYLRHVNTGYEETQRGDTNLSDYLHWDYRELRRVIDETSELVPRWVMCGWIAAVVCWDLRVGSRINVSQML